MRGPALDIKARIHDRVTGEPARTWSPADFADLGSRVAVDTALHRLVAAGELRRVGRGLYDKPWTNTLTGRPSSPDVDAAIAAIVRQKGLRYVVDGMTAANDLGLTDAVPAKTVVHVNARLRPVKLGNLEIVFKPVSDAKLAWAGRPAMRLVQALHWLKDTLPRDELVVTKKVRRLLEKEPEGQAIRNDLEAGFGMLPTWMQEMLRPMVFGEHSPHRQDTGKIETTS